MPRFKANSQEMISLVVKDVITKHGFPAAIGDLLTTVRYFAAASLADDDNRQLELEYKRWSKAVKAACRAEECRTKQPKTFDQVVSKNDAILARGMGILLD